MSFLSSPERANCLGTYQVDLKKLLRKPPVVEMPSAEETLQNQPFIGALPEPVQEMLLDAAKEHMKVQSSAIYGEGGKPDGIWLIANGVVKVSFHMLCLVIDMSRKYFKQKPCYLLLHSETSCYIYAM